MKKFLIIQTAFTGDVVLATPVAEKLHRFFPDAEIDFLVKKGNESLFKDHPFIKEVFVFDKKNGKLKNIFRLRSAIRKKKYDAVINLHRFGSSGFLTACSGAKEKIGFDKNPFSFLFTKKIKHEIGNSGSGGKHEVRRNLDLIAHLTDLQTEKPKLYPSDSDLQIISYHTNSGEYVCMAPTSVWFTKQWPKEKWVELIKIIPSSYRIFLLGGPADSKPCDKILKDSCRNNIANLCGQLSFLQSAALMKGAKMNYVNDSAPMHFASAINAPVTAIYCSTVPAFGFGPLSDNSRVIETEEKLSCRPCGLHGYKECPEIHFKCARTIEVKKVMGELN
ncbi:MAG: glycosyltransferase family 9 protein [Bacteroidetes bacterium]|nr:glycosyltransferase family 9 protein [Bacteroidota bacterium]